MGDYVKGKLDRQCLATYIDASFGGTTPEWFLIGKDIDDMSVELGADTEVKKNILGETSVKHNGYEPKMSADPYYANPEDSIYEKLKDIAMNRKKGSDCQTKILEVLIDKETGPFDAWQEDVMVVPQKYGGGTEGVAIPFDVLFNGNRTSGTASITNKVPVFTESTTENTTESE